MARYFIHLAYHGKNYSGWQRQLKDRSVQQTIEEILAKFFNEEIRIMGCGRTDAGVHASSYYAHFDTEKPLPEDFVHKLNCYSRQSIAFYSVEKVSNDAHARFDAIKRSYVYKMHFEKDPFKYGLSWMYALGNKPDFELMNKTAKKLLEFKDFETFCKTGGSNNTFFCNLSRCEWISKNDDVDWEFHISSNRFLRGMVRLVAGGLILVGRGKIGDDEFLETVLNKKRIRIPYAVPAWGLYLTEVVYPDHILLNEN
ncbi:MAG: tRNA pseudouridine synthase A [Chitinophagaceae bacterium]|nr:MAG: tRNA pseudouridine synthase A [Chitinophagaceae bacterium]